MLPAWIASFDIAAAVACAGVLARSRRSLAKTTLTAAGGWCWPVLAIFVAAHAGSVLLGASIEQTSHWHYLAALATFGPPMAVLGAKRPQHRAWQAIVGSLLVVLAWPSLSLLALGRTGPLQLHATWKIFLGALWLAGWPNYLPTRFRSSAVLYGGGQALALAPAFWPAGASTESWPAYAGAGALACFLLSAWLAVHSRSSRRGDSAIAAAWLDFRDAYGAVWGLRVLERFNALATSHAWPVRLTWRGFELAPTAAIAGDAAGDACGAAEVPVEAARQLESLLCRFVSADWIAGRKHCT